ncbi:MAG: DUF938 domain-containing protein [Pseudomonadota bacterium]
MHNAKKDSPSFHRNIGPITGKLDEILDTVPLRVLEIGSGSGQHAVSLATAFPNFHVQPTDIDDESIESIRAWIKETGVDNVHDPLKLDVTQEHSPFTKDTMFDLIVCFNVIHITPWDVTDHLFDLGDKVISPNGRLLLYGPFKIEGRHTSESNVQFEQWLKSKDPSFGVRDLEDVRQTAEQYNFPRCVQHQMPSNNFLLEFTRA